MADNIVTVQSKQGRIHFRDFIESNDDNVNDKVDEIVIQRINSN